MVDDAVVDGGADVDVVAVATTLVVGAATVTTVARVPELAHAATSMNAPSGGAHRERLIAPAG